MTSSPFLGSYIPTVLRQHVSAHEQAHQWRIQQWREGDWFGMHTQRVVEVFEPFIIPLELSQLLNRCLGNDLQMIVLEYATCAFSLPHVGVVLQDERMILWDKTLGKPLAWLLKLIVKQLNLPLTVETIKSPPDIVITTFFSSDSPSEVTHEQPKLETSRWTLVVLHDRGANYYEKLMKSFRARVVLKLPGVDKQMLLVEPPESMSQKKKKAVTEAKVWVKEVVHIKARSLITLGACFEAPDGGFLHRLHTTVYRIAPKHAKLGPYDPGTSENLARRLTKATTLTKQSSRCHRDCQSECSNTQCQNYCFDSDCVIEMITSVGVDGNDNGVKSASQILVGDCVRGIWADGTRTSAVVVGVVKELVGRSVGMVEVSPGNFLTPGHPLQTSAGGLFVRPKQISPLQHKHVEALYNFVLSERVALVLHTAANSSCPSRSSSSSSSCSSSVSNDLSITAANQPLSSSSSPLFVACSSLGQFCLGVDEEGSFFGTSRVIHQCMQHPEWPYITKNSTRN